MAFLVWVASWMSDGVVNPSSLGLHDTSHSFFVHMALLRHNEYLSYSLSYRHPGFMRPLFPVAERSTTSKGPDWRIDLVL